MFPPVVVPTDPRQRPFSVLLSTLSQSNEKLVVTLSGKQPVSVIRRMKAKFGRLVYPISTLDHSIFLKPSLTNTSSENTSVINKPTSFALEKSERIVTSQECRNFVVDRFCIINEFFE